MIYTTSLNRKAVEIIGRYPPQKHRFRFDGKEEAPAGVEFQYVRVRDADGREADADFYELRADDGIRELWQALAAAPLIEADNPKEAPA